MEDDNVYVYEGEGEDEMYVIDEVAEETGSFEPSADFQLYSLQEQLLQNGENLDGYQSIFYDESGQAYMVNRNHDESNSVYENASNPNNRTITYNCPVCAQVYNNANAFTKHTREKHFVKVYTCRQCEKFFDNLSLLFLHARRTHVDPLKPTKNPANFKFHCPDCDYMTNNGGTMEHHRRAHSGIKPYKCDICDKAFAQKANMKTHKNRHIHKDRIFRCDTCSKSFNSHDIYLAHLRTREHELQEHFQMIITSKVQIQCLGCNETFESYYDANKHSQSCDILKDLTNIFWCVECSLGFPTAMSLKHHLKTHVGSNQVISCPVCGERGFPGFNQLNHHITRAHSLKVNRRNVCRYCETTFETKAFLDDHIKEMHLFEKNGRQSRGIAGRLRCRYEICEFTSNSVMLMDRHHNQHMTNTLPSDTNRIPRRPRKSIIPLILPTIEKEEMIDAEIEHFHSDLNRDEVLRLNNNLDNDYIKEELVDGDNEDMQKRIHEDFIDDMDVDDLEKLATFYVEEPIKPVSCDVKRKRGRPRKCTKPSVEMIPKIKNENFEVVEENDIYDHSLGEEDYYRQFEEPIDEVDI